VSRKALIEHRPLLAASLLAGIAYYILASEAAESVWLIGLKGAGVGLLALYALQRTSAINGAILTIALALSAAADMVLVINFEAGGALFFASHLLATALYLRNLRPETTPNQILCTAACVIAVPAIAWGLSLRGDIAAYSSALGIMAAAAWLSRFPRYRVGIGALLFVISDWLIFSRMGSIDLAPLPDLLVWPTYYAGQFMIATGVVQTLASERREAAQ